MLRLRAAQIFFFLSFFFSFSFLVISQPPAQSKNHRWLLVWMKCTCRISADHRLVLERQPHLPSPSHPNGTPLISKRSSSLSTDSPSISASQSILLSLQPSMSIAPSVSPTSSPTIAGQPSPLTSDTPSVSTQPSSQPSTSPSVRRVPVAARACTLPCPPHPSTWRSLGPHRCL